MFWNVTGATQIPGGGEIVKSLYLLLLIFSIIVPLAFSFGPRLKFYKNYKFIFPAIALTAVIFIAWDVWFTKSAVWRFNNNFVTEFYILNLPVEEWLFFIFIPYSCIFIHDSLKYYLPFVAIEKYGKRISLSLSILLLLTAFLNFSKLYTAVTFITLSGYLLLLRRFMKNFNSGRFYFTYLITLIPFAIVNGFLTAMPVLIYNDSENLGTRIGTIPIEDFFYSMLLLLINISVYEYLKSVFMKREIAGK
jgi:lycopene cyclase domain-containing protein